MPEITRAVILDLLPLYLEGEVSADTRALVEAYLASDPELAHSLTQIASQNLQNAVEYPTEEDQMTAYKETKRIQLFRTLAITAGISLLLTILCSLIVWAPVAYMFLTR